MAKKRRPKTGPGSIDEWVIQQQGLHFCRCGCGQPIVIKRRHSEPGRGIPEYLRGHSIWEQGLPGQGGGQSSPSWKGGRVHHSAGYIMVHCPAHPFAISGGYILEHRLILEQHLRETAPDSPYLIEVNGEMYLRSDVIAHHIDHSKDNNDAGNLMPLRQGEHLAMHNRERAAARKAATRSLT